jgi:predicted HTH transcriptional regulator
MTTDDYVLLSLLFQKRDDVNIHPERFANLLKLGIVKKTELGMELVEGKLIVTVNDTSVSPTVSSSVPQELATNAWDTLKLSDRQKQILTFISNNEKTTSVEIASHTGLSQGGIRKYLIDLANAGLVKKVGDNRYAYYVIVNADE